MNISRCAFKVRTAKAYLAIQVDAVDKDITLNHLLERTTGRRLLHIPLDDILLGNTRLDTHVHRATTAAAQSANNDDARHSASLVLALGKGLLDVGHQGVLVGVALHAGKGLARVEELVSPVLDGEGSAGKTCMGTERGNSPAILFEEFEVEEGPASSAVAA